LAFVIVVAAVAQAVGAAIGSGLSTRLGRAPGAVREGDRIAGGVLGVVGVLVLMWLLIPALASSPGWTARAVRDSALARLIDRVAPSPPSESETLGRLVGDQSFPEVFDTLSSPDAGAPPSDGIPAAVAKRVESSTLLVEGQACDRIQEGTGFVAGTNLVVTNAHVVAGEHDTRVTTYDGRRLDATVVAFDPNRDLAVLRVPGLGLPALELGEAHVDDRGALFGHPGGGPLVQAPVRIAEQIVARGTDITRSHPTEREVFVLAAVTAPGDSGGPIVDPAGNVVGVMFAYDISRQTTAYALTRTELDAVLGPVLAGQAPSSVATGDCLAD
jgi:S1-C subfamily serine protease